MTFVDRLPDKSVYKVGRKGKVRLFGLVRVEVEMRKGVKARCNTTIVVMRPIYSLQSVRFEVRVGDSSVFSISPHGPLIQIASSRSHFRFATKVLTKPFPSCKIHEDESTTSFFYPCITNIGRDESETIRLKLSR